MVNHKYRRASFEYDNNTDAVALSNEVNNDDSYVDENTIVEGPLVAGATARTTSNPNISVRIPRLSHTTSYLCRSWRNFINRRLVTVCYCRGWVNVHCTGCVLMYIVQVVC